MYKMIVDNLGQLGIRVSVAIKNDVAYLLTDRKYLHYDEIDWIVKCNSFKGISIQENMLVIEILV